MKEVKVCLLAGMALFTVLAAESQLTGTKNIPGDYATLAAAITDLNTQGVGSGGVILNLVAGNPQTAPAGGYSITATGTAANTINVTGNSNTVTAPTPQASGSLNDAIFKIIGGDYITIQGFTMLENASNTTTTAGTNNMTEFGVALFYSSPTNGSKNNTIQNNTITLNRTYQNTFGIYSNVRHTATSMTTTADITSASGSNSNNKFYSNIISNVNFGMVIVGSLTGDYMDTGLDVGGNSLSTGNTITNFGTTTSFSGYVSVTTTINGINANNCLGLNISYNNITSSNGGVTAAGTIRGIFCQASGTLPIYGSYSRSINNNTISVKGGAAANVLNGILVDNGNATTMLSMNNNDFNSFGHTVSGTGLIQIISISGGTQNLLNINNNTFTNISVNTTGSVTLINMGVGLDANGVANVNNNSIVTAFTKTGAGGTVTGYTSSAQTPGSATETNTGNNFSNITASVGATAITVWNQTTGATKTITNNTFSNINGGTGALTVLTVSSSNSANVSANTIMSITGGAAITGISSAGSAGVAQSFFANNIHTLSSTGASLVRGIFVSGPFQQNIYNNKIYDLSGSNAGSSVTGIATGGSTDLVAANIYNNLIGDLRVPAANAANPLIGINVNTTSSSSTINVYDNTIYLNASSSGTNFGSSGISHTISTTATTGTLTMKNNIIVNTSTPSGTGLTVAFRRSGTALNNYTTASNNNLFYAGTPGASNLIYNDGTNSDQTLAACKTRMGTRDGSSVTESPIFLSTTGSSSNFLHIDAVVATQIESGGIPVATVTTDYDNESRNATNPDIGADEFGGTANDITGPTVSYTELSNTVSTANRTIVATITDASGIASGGSAPLIYYRKGTGGSYTSAVATSIAGNDYTFTIDNSALGGVTNGDIIQYYFAAQDIAGNLTTSPYGGSGITPPGTTAPVTPNQYKIIQSYTWQGITNDFQLATNWSPNRTTPDVSDVLVFDGSVTASTTANNILTQTVSKLVLQNNVIATLDAAVANNVLTFDNGTGETVFDIQSGSTMNAGTTTAINFSFGISKPGQLANIAGTLNLNQASLFTASNGITTVSGTVTLNAASDISGNATTFSFDNGSILNYAKPGGSVPIAHYQPNSTINITNDAVTLMVNTFGSMGNLVWNCPGQTANFAGGACSIGGSFTLQSTGSGSMSLAGGTIINGNATITNGTWNIPNGTLTIGGNLIQNGGTISRTGTTSNGIVWNADSVSQTAGTINMNAVTGGIFILNATSGNMSFAGTVNGGTVAGMALGFTGTGNQTLNTTGATVSNFVGLTVNKTSGNCTLLSDHIINNGAAVTLLNGKLTIAASKTLTIAPGATVSGAGSSKYFVSDVSGANIGKLKYSGLTTGAQNFPIGSVNNYMPVTITPTTTGSSFAAGVFEGATQNGTPNGSPITTPDANDIVNAVWQIDNSIISTSASINLSWAASLEGTNFTALANTDIGIQHYNGSGYDLATGSGDNTANTASSSFSSFSPFIVGKIANSCTPGTTATWMGTIDNDYNKPGNWSTGCVPTAAMNILIPSGTPTLTGGTASIKNVTIQPGATLNLDDGAVLNVKGDFVNDGTIASGGSPVTGKTIFNGTVLQNISGNGVFSNVEIDNPTDVIVITDISVKTILVLPGAQLTVLTSKTLTVLQ